MTTRGADETVYNPATRELDDLDPSASRQANSMRSVTPSPSRIPARAVSPGRKHERMQITDQDAPLREEIAFLGEMLGGTIQRIAGTEALEIVERLRRLAWDRRRRQPGAAAEMIDFISGLSDDQLRVVIRAFSIFLDLANLAEDRQRVRVLRQREQAAYPDARGESIRAAVLRLKRSGKSVSEMQQMLDQLHIELVFTAHPTEAKRRSIRSKLRNLRRLMRTTDCEHLPAERDETQRLIRVELAKLWQTDFIRPWRPSVMQEVRRGLSIKPVLWDVVPRILNEFRQSLHETFPDNQLPPGPYLTFGSWIGGDRDGHPDVTTEVTEQTFLWLRTAALEFHLAAASTLFDSLSLSRRQVPVRSKLTDGLTRACKRWPALAQKLAEIPPNEAFRRWIGMIHWRLQQTQDVSLDKAAPEGAYARADELGQDVSTLFDSVSRWPAGELIAEEVRVWLDRIQVFGFHLARLDVRQESSQYRAVINELMQHLGLSADPEALDETERQQVLIRTLSQNIQLPTETLSEAAKETLDLFRLLHRVVERFGSEAVGGHVISMTHVPSDVLTVLWLWRQTAIDSGGSGDPIETGLPIIPLFETISDLQHAPEILEGILALPEYRDYLRRQGDHQIVMLGYSDSTKDGGYLSACWALYNAQRDLHTISTNYAVDLTFFHGRGGSLGRGGGPAARSILSLPARTFHGSLRLTEQGEVLADRYDDPTIAHRHLEQIVWSSLLACGEPIPQVRPEWLETMQQLATRSYGKYRQLVEQPEFVSFFRRATPITEIEQLPIGSRPARRQGSNQLTDLRAIPWVFSWTQCRCLLPAWFGIGSAAAEFMESPSQRDLLQSMYRQWPFFRATVDNAELALAKTDLGIAEHYAGLADDSESLARIGSMIGDEFRRTRAAILEITGNSDLLDGTPWLKESIRVRNRYLDPLNLIQVELLRRLQNCCDGDESQIEELRHLTRLTISGLAAGMRTSG